MNNQEVSTAYVGSTEIKEARLGTQLVLAPGGDALWYKANEIPTLDLRFADNKSLVDATTGANLVTFSRSTGGTYTDSQGVLRTALVNESRFDHDPTTGESLGLLVEESRTNLLLRSEEFGTSPWAVSNATVTPNQAVAPDGTATADLLTKSVAYGAAYQITDVASLTTHTVSFYVKKATNQYASLAVTDNAAANIITRAYINLDTGVVTNATGTTVADPVGNGWYRVSSSFSYTNALNRIYLYPGIYSDTSTGGIYLWGAQLEAGSFPTSYIKNVDTPGGVTRAADVVNITGANFSSWYNQSEGTVFARSRLARQASVAGTGILGIETGVTSAEAIYMHYRSSGLTAAQVFDNSVSQADFSPYGSVVPANTTISQTIAFRTNDTNASGGGGIGTTDTTCSMPTPDRLLIGYNSAAGIYLSGHIRRLTYWPQRLPNSTLQTITQ